MQNVPFLAVAFRVVVVGGLGWVSGVWIVRVRV
jgi:hypothetical protein